MNKYSPLIATLVLLTSASGCTNSFDDINTDPNRINVGKITPYNLFEPVLYGMANDAANDTRKYNGELVQYTACTGSFSPEFHRYVFGDNDYKRMWNLWYNYSKNCTHMYELAEQNGDKAVMATALTLKAWNMANITDMYGDCPYSEAFMARVNGNTKPVFDSQQSVYTQLLQELEEANDLYAQNPTFIKPTLDGMYEGNMKKWRKFNNALMLRLLCRISNRTESGATDKIKDMVTDQEKYPLMKNADDNAIIKYSGISPYVNYFYSANETEGSFTTNNLKMTEQMVNLMVETQDGNQVFCDPRTAIFFTKSTGAYNPDNKWIGTVSGCSTADARTYDLGACYLNFHTLAHASSPVTLMDYAEQQFILAEMANRGIITGGDAQAKQYYESAVKASCQKWEMVRGLVTDWGRYDAPAAITDADINTLLASPLASWDSSADKARLIGEQKYLALFWTDYQAFHEIRRTGYPELKIGPATDSNNNEFPTRMQYCTNTIASNAENVRLALDHMGGENDMHTPVWWSKKAISSKK